MWDESIATERKRLLALEKEGFDIDNAISELDILDNGWKERNEDSMVSVLAESSASPISSFTIEALNRNNPRKGRTPITITSGYISNDKVVYNYTYPKSDKEYTAKASEITADQMDPTLSNVERLGAQVDDEVNYDNFDREVDNALDSVENAESMINDLASIEAGKDSEQHLEDLKEFVRMFAGKNYSEGVKTFIKQSEGRSKGTFVFDRLAETGRIKIETGTAVRQAANEMSAASKWVHEVGHAISEFALGRKDPETRATMRRLRHLREQARKVITVDMLMPTNSIDSKRERVIAENLLKYMFDNTESGMSEFIVHAVTNPEVKKALKNVVIYRQKEVENNNIFESIVSVVTELFNKILATVRREDYDTTGDELALKLMKDIAKANNKAARIRREASVLSKVSDKIGDVEDKLREVLEKFSKDLLKKDLPIPPIGKGKIAFVKYIIKTVPFMFSDPRLRLAYENILSVFGAKPEQSIQTWIRNLSKSDTLANSVAQLDALSQQIDSRRELTEAITEKQLLEAFKEHPTDAEMDALTLVGLQGDLEVIFDNYDKATLVKLMEDDKALVAEIKRKRQELVEKADNKRDSNWYINQANGLGYFMATYIANGNQNMNAENIAKGFGRAVMKDSVDPDIVKAIDELTSLEALRYNSKDQRDIIADLVNKDVDGVKNLIYVHRNFKKEASNKLFYGDSHRMIKGFTKEIFNSDVDVQIRPLRERIDLEKQGYRLVQEIKNKTNMGVFVSNEKNTPTYNKQSVRLTDSGRKGTSIGDIHKMEGGPGSSNNAKAEIAYSSISMLRLSKAQEEGILDIDREDAEWGLSPMFNAKGKAVDFRYMMNKAAKRALMEQDLRAPKVLGRMLAGIQDKVETKAHNETVFKAIMTDMEANYSGRKGLLGRNGKEYIKIDRNSSNEDIADLWGILPDDMKKNISDTEGGVFVRRDMLHMYFGNRDFSLAYTKFGKKLPRQIQTLVRVGELFWQDLIRLFKVEIIIKTPAVIIGNIVSNFLYGVMTGNNPLEVMKLQLNAIRDMREFMNMNRELIELEIARKSGNVKKSDLGRIGVLKEDIAKHPMKEFASEGLFQAIIEDVGLNEFAKKDRVTGKIQEKLEAVPRIKTGLDWLFLTEKTGFFKAITAATQLSDAAARKAKMDLDKKHYDKLINRGISKRESLKRVFLLTDQEIDEILKEEGSWDKVYNSITRSSARDAFVNYSGEDVLTKYANDMGLVMFTKYLQRIQKVIRKGVVQHPMFFLLAILGQNTLTGEFDTIDDKLLDMPFSPSYLDRLMDLVVPASLDIGSDIYTTVT